MTQSKLKERIKEIVEQNKLGFTLYLPSLEFANSGWVIANDLTQSFHGDEGLDKALKFAMRYNRLLGGWLEESNGLFYYDAVILEPDKKKALELMKMHNREAFLIWKLVNILKIRIINYEKY